MLNRNNLIIGIGFSLALLLNACMAQAEVAPVAINKETKDYIIDIKYPQGFESAQVNSAIQAFIDTTQKNFMNELSEDEDTPADAPGKTGITVTYTIPYQTKNVLSVRFDISIFHKGAAHPANTIDVENFLKNHPVKMADLFISGADYLKLLSDYSSKVITARKISDADWIKEGTKPTEDNYAVWQFSKKGIDIIFNTYQVAAYVYGPQTVGVPLSVISSIVKPELAKALWGN